MTREVPESVHDATPFWPDPPRSEGPNIVVVVLDDTGFADLGCYGSEVSTPHLDALANDGLRFNNFHTTPLCSPTRAALLTGRNHHTVGMRFLAVADTGFSNCRGRIAPAAGTVAEALRAGGYATMATGKWHLVPNRHGGAAGPFHDWPTARGFERFYGFLGGAVDQWHPDLVQDNHVVEAPETDDYHVSADIIDRSITYLRDHLSLRADDPFFLYVSFAATHAPHQVPLAFIEPYVEPSRQGWDVIREARYRRQIKLGVIPPNTALAPRNPDVRPWQDLTESEQELAAHLHAAYCGFMEHTDLQIGRLVEFLSDRGILDDTLLLVLSDNGGSMEGGDLGAVNVHTSYATRPQGVDDQLDRLHLLGTPASSPHYAAGWAMASNTPFKRYKRFVDGGGVNTPLIAHWPKGITDTDSVRGAFVHVIDVMPTLLELAAIEPPTRLNDVEQLPIAGQSFAGLLASSGAGVERDRAPQYFEMFGQRAIWADGWKAVAEHRRGTPYSGDQWHLYDLTRDLSETRDLAIEEPARLQEMINLWHEEARRNDVFPLDDRGMNELLHTGRSHTEIGFELIPGQSRISPVLIPGMMSYRISGTLHLTGSDSGIYVARGGEAGGFALFAIDGEIIFEVNELGRPYRLASRPDSPGNVTIEATLERVGVGARATLRVGRAGTVCDIDAYYGSSFLGLQIGRNGGSAVSAMYRDRQPFACDPASVKQLRIDFFEPDQPPPLDELDALPPQ